MTNEPVQPTQKKLVWHESQKALPTFDAQGRKVGTGKKKSRVILEGSDDARFAVAAKTAIDANKSGFLTGIHRKWRAVRYITVEMDGTKIDLNINSLSKRLHIAKKDIKSADNPQVATEMVSRVDIEKLRQALDHYEKIFQNRKALQKFNIDTATLMKVVKTSLEVLHEVETPKGKLFKFKVSDYTYGVYGDSGNLVAHIKKLGEGGFGKVYSVIGLQNPRATLALKEVHPRLAGDTYGSARHETRIVAEVHKRKGQNQLILDEEGSPVGIVDEPLEVTDVLGSSLNASGGMLMTQCIGDLQVCFHESMRNKLRIAGQLLAGGVNMSKSGVIHYDVKPHNVLVRKNRQGRWIAQVADFGNAKLKPVSGSNPDDIERIIFEIPLSATALYLTKDLYEESTSAVTDDSLEQRMIADERLDVFAMGKTLFELFVAKTFDPDVDDSPFKFATDSEVKVINEIDFEAVQKQLKSAGVPKPMIEIVVAMLKVGQKEAPTYNFERAFSVFKSDPKLSKYLPPLTHIIVRKGKEKPLKPEIPNDIRPQLKQAKKRYRDAKDKLELAGFRYSDADRYKENSEAQANDYESAKAKFEAAKEEFEAAKAEYKALKPQKSA